MHDTYVEHVLIDFCMSCSTSFLMHLLDFVWNQHFKQGIVGLQYVFSFLFCWISCHFSWMSCQNTNIIKHVEYPLDCFPCIHQCYDCLVRRITEIIAVDGRQPDSRISSGERPIRGQYLVMWFSINQSEARET